MNDRRLRDKTHTRTHMHKWTHGVNNSKSPASATKQSETTDRLLFLTADFSLRLYKFIFKHYRNY